MNEPLTYSGLNNTGLRRHNFSSQCRTIIKKVYKIIYQSSLNTTQALEKIKMEFEITPEINNIINFIQNIMLLYGIINVQKDEVYIIQSLQSYLHLYQNLI